MKLQFLTWREWRARPGRAILTLLNLVFLFCCRQLGLTVLNFIPSICEADLGLLQSLRESSVLRLGVRVLLRKSVGAGKQTQPREKGRFSHESHLSMFGLIRHVKGPCGPRLPGLSGTEFFQELASFGELRAAHRGLQPLDVGPHGGAAIL